MTLSTPAADAATDPGRRDFARLVLAALVGLVALPALSHAGTVAEEPPDLDDELARFAALAEESGGLVARRGPGHLAADVAGGNGQVWPLICCRLPSRPDLQMLVLDGPMSDATAAAIIKLYRADVEGQRAA